MSEELKRFAGDVIMGEGIDTLEASTILKGERIRLRSDIAEEFMDRFIHLFGRGTKVHLFD